MTKMRRKVLHITVHLGGGVGKAILGVASLSDRYFETKIIVLEDPEKISTIKRSEEEGINVMICPSEEEVRQQLEMADIVIINWWSHPLMSKFLLEMPPMRTRMAIWVHINGCTYPYLPFAFLDRFDYIFFTTKYSYQNALWNRKELEIIQNKSTIVLGNGKFQPALLNAGKDYQRREFVRVGYVGTLSYSKINRDYVKYCEKAAQYCADIKFIMAGDPDSQLIRDIEDSAVKDKFVFLGYVDDTQSLYLSLDILGYILNKDNFATTENVILEAMSYGIPVIAYDGGVERVIIDNGVNGFLVHNPEEFAECVKELAENVELQRRIGKAGREKVCVEFSCENNITLLLESCEKLCERGKQFHDFTEIYGSKPIDWFLYFTGPDREVFENYLSGTNKEGWRQLLVHKPIYKGLTKSSIKHFFRYFPNEESFRKMVDGLV